MTKTPSVSLALSLLQKDITTDKALNEDHDLEPMDSMAGKLLIGQDLANPQRKEVGEQLAR